MPRKKKIESLPFQPCDAPGNVDTGNNTDLPPPHETDPFTASNSTIMAESLLDQALAHYGLHGSDVFAVRSVAPGAIRIITRDAQKFTYPPRGEIANVQHHSNLSIDSAANLVV